MPDDGEAALTVATFLDQGAIPTEQGASAPYCKSDYFLKAGSGRFLLDTRIVVDGLLSIPWQATDRIGITHSDWSQTLCPP